MTKRKHLLQVGNFERDLELGPMSLGEDNEVLEEDFDTDSEPGAGSGSEDDILDEDIDVYDIIADLLWDDNDNIDEILIHNSETVELFDGDVS